MNRIVIAAGVVVLLLAGYFFFSPSPTITNGPPSFETIVSFGDSLTFGTGAAPDKSYPAQLAERIGHGIINEGISGDTTARALQRIDSVLQHNPSLVMLTLGGNDLKNGVEKDVAFAQMGEIIERFQSFGAVVVLGGVSFPLLDKGYGDGYRELAEESGAILVPNVLDGIFGHQQLMTDMVHPNAAGYGVMADHFYQALEPYL